MTQRESLEPIEGANRAVRRRLWHKGECRLALGPTLMVLLVLLAALRANHGIRRHRIRIRSRFGFAALGVHGGAPSTLWA